MLFSKERKLLYTLIFNEFERKLTGMLESNMMNIKATKNPQNIKTRP